MGKYDITVYVGRSEQYLFEGMLKELNLSTEGNHVQKDMEETRYKFFGVSEEVFNRMDTFTHEDLVRRARTTLIVRPVVS